MNENKLPELIKDNYKEQEERRFRALGDMLEVTRWHWTLDEEGNITEIWGNDSLKKLYGYDFTDEDEQSIQAWLEGIHPDYKEGASLEIERFRQQKKEPALLDLTYPILDGDGETRWVHVLGQKLFDEEGRPVEALGTVKDITASVQAEEKQKALVSLARTYKSLHRFDLASDQVETIYSTSEVEMWVDPERSAQSTMSSFVQNLSSEDTREKCKEFADFHTLQERMRGKESISLIFKDPMDGWCRASFIRINEGDPVEEVLFPVESIDEQIQKDKRINDIINVLAENYSTVFYVETETQSAHLIRANRLEQPLVELFRSERTFREMMQEYTALAVGEEYIEHFMELSDPEYVLKELDGQERLTYTYQRRIEGELAYFRMNVVPFNNGRGLIYGYENIDEEVRRTRELETRNKQVSAAEAIIRVLSGEFHTVWLVDKENGRMRLVRSESLENKTGSVVEQIRVFEHWDGPTEFYVSQFVAEDDRERVRHAVRFQEVVKQLEENGYYEINFRQPQEDRISHQQIVFRNADTADGMLQFIAAFRSVDRIVEEQLQRQAELEESRRVLEEANQALAQKDAAMDMLYQMIDSGSWTMIYDKEHQPVSMYWDENIRRMIGWSEEEVPASLENWIRILHPDDVEHAQKSWNAHVRGIAEQYDCEWRIGTKSEGWRWYRVKARLEAVDELGNYHYFGVFIDIHDAKTREEEHRLREMEEKRLSTVYEMIDAARWQWKIQPDGTAYDVWWSDQFKALFDYDKDVIPSDETWRASIAEEDRMDVLLATREFNTTDIQEFVLEYRLITQSNESRWVRAHAKKMVGKSGEPTEVIGTCIDITAQKKAEWETRIVKSLASEYDTIHTVNIREHTSVRYRYSGRIDSVREQIFNEPDYISRAKAFIELGVDPEYRKTVRHALEPETIRERLKEATSFSTIYLNAENQYCEMKIVRLDEDRIVLGFAQKDEEMRQRLKLNEEVSLQKLLIQGLSQSYDTVWYLNPQDHSVEMIGGNPQNSTGIEIAELSGKENFREYLHTFLTDLVVPEDRERVVREMNMDWLAENMEDGKPHKINYAFIGFDGVKHYIQANVIRERDAEGKAHIALALRLTDEEILAELTKQEAHQKELEEALEQAKAANAAKSTFLFNMSHDIRTPLNAIIGFTDLAGQNREDREKAEDYRQKVMKASMQLADILNNVLEMARIENKKIVIEEELEDAEDMFESTVSMFEGEARKKGHSLVSSFDLSHRFLYMDKTHMAEVLMNIISNAIKYTPDGGRIDVEIHELPGKTEADCMVETTVRDNGMGMSQEFVAKIFEEFSRERNSSQSGIQGTGLGMAIVKNLVELMGGNIRIQSEPGAGTEIKVRIPHRIGEAPEITEDIDITSGKEVLIGKRILLAEDIDVNAMLIQEILRMNGMESERAHDGAECVSMLEAAEAGYYDLILMDIQMPNMNGYEATRQIRSLDEEGKANLPIIALSANAFKEDMMHSLEAGMNGHLAKPIDVDALLAKLTELLHGHVSITLKELLLLNDIHIKEIQSSDKGVYCTDEIRRIIYWNPAAEKITGYTADQVTGRHCFYSGMKHEDEHHNQLCVNNCPLMATKLDGMQRSERVSCLCGDGVRRWIRIQTQPLYYNDEVQGVIEFFQLDQE